MAQSYEDIENVLQAAHQLPEFPAKLELVQCLETRNVNEYGRALQMIAELSVEGKPKNPQITAALDGLATRIRLLEASEQVSE